MKECSKCKNSFPFSFFYKDAQKKDGLCSVCKNCSKQEKKKYYEDNIEKIREKNKLWVKNNLEKVKRIASNWRKNNIEKAREIERKSKEKNKNKAKESYRKWEKSHPDSVKARYNNRRARKAGNGGSFSSQEWNDLCRKYDNKCVCCKEEKKLCADHIIPLFLGGTSNIENIQPLCKSCNSRKSTKIIDYRGL